MKFSQKRLARPSVGGLLATRQGSLLLALMCAVVAAAILMFALGRYKSNLNVVPQQATALVATGEIKKGMTGEQIARQRLYKSTPVVQSQLSSGAIANAGTLATEVAQTDILPGQQLTSTQFTASAGTTALLTPGQRAISLQIDEAHGDTDTLTPGDHVDIYCDFNVASGSSTGGASSEMVLLISNATVVKPGTSTTVRTAGRAITGTSLVLAISNSDVPVLAYGADSGRLWVSLRPTDATKTSTVPVTLQSILAQRGLSNGGH